MKKEKVIARLYRITKKQDAIVKKNGKKYGGESAYIRKLIEEGIILEVRKL